MFPIATWLITQYSNMCIQVRAPQLQVVIGRREHALSTADLCMDLSQYSQSSHDKSRPSGLANAPGTLHVEQAMEIDLDTIDDDKKENYPT